MTVIVCLTLILLGLMLGVGGRKGLQSFLSLLLNLLVIIVAILLMSRGISPLVLTVIASLLISALNLFFINDVNRKTLVAFVGTMVTILCLVIFIFLVVKGAKVQGLGEEELVELDMYSLKIGIDFMSVAICVIIMSTVGAINDTAISMASAMSELEQRNPTLVGRKLVLSGLKVGQDVIGATINTLLFAFMGGGLALVIWLKDLNYSFEQMVNAKVVVSEVIAILFSGMGVVLVVPITAWLMAWNHKKVGSKI